MSGEGMLGAPALAPAALPSHRVDAAGTAPISVVVPTRDTRELTLRCLGCLAAARPAPAEVIVVDDGSTDGTTDAIAASYPGVRVLGHASPRGFTAAANSGAAVAASDLLLLLNSDTEVAPDALGALADAFRRDSALGVAGALLFYADGRPQWSGGGLPGPFWLLALATGAAHRLGAISRWRRRRPVSGHQDRPVDWVTGAALATRRSLWERLRGFDARFRLYAQDLDFCVRARSAGWKVAVVPSSRVVHLHGATVQETSGVTAARHDPARLWADLVRWKAKQGGAPAARRAARVLGVGGAMQRLMLRLEGLRGGEVRRRADAERRALQAAGFSCRDADAEVLVS
jgi:GT2 family glycosyltransferase